MFSNQLRKVAKQIRGTKVVAVDVEKEKVKMLEKGYNYIVIIPGKDPLYTKTMGAASELLRTDLKMDSGVKIEKISRTAAFMEPQVWQGTFYEIDTKNGTFTVDVQDSGDFGVADKDTDPEAFAELAAELAQYTESDAEGINSIEQVKGWGAMLSAPGYMDRTDLSVYDTEQAAIDGLKDMYGDDEDEMDEDEV
jgi:hypothetical protein